MKTRSTLILLAVVVALGLFIRFHESDQPGTREARETEQYLVRLEPEKVRTITITDGETVVALERKDDRWRVTAPVEDRADVSVAQQILNDAEFLRREQTIPAGANKDEARARLSEFGLTNPRVELAFGGKDAPPPIRFGKETAVEGRIYARLGEAQDAYVIADSLLDTIRKKPDDFRDRRLSELEPSEVGKLLVKSAAGEIEAVREKGRWRLTRPIKARADDARVGNLITQVANTRIEAFLSPAPDAAATQGFNDPRGSVTLVPEEGGEPQVLEFGGDIPDDPKKIAARFAARKGLYHLAKESASVLETKPNDLRDRKLSRFDRDLVDRVTIASKVHGKTVLARNKEAWTLNPDKEGKGRTASRGDVSAILDRLQSSEVREFVADSAGDLGRYGLQDPALRITVSSFSSENTSEAAAGEHPILTVAFGRVENGMAYARVEEEPFVVGVDPALLEELNLPGVRLREATVFSGNAEEIKAFQVRKADGIEVRVERGGDGAWKAPGGGEPVAKPVAIQSLANVLANLRAVRWEAAKELPTHGFETPALAIRFTAGSEERTLTVGAPSPDGHRFAKASSSDGVFLLNLSDFATLDLPIETPVQAPSPVPAPSPATGSPVPVPTP